MRARETRRRRRKVRGDTGKKVNRVSFFFFVLTLSYMKRVMIDVFPTAWSPKNTCFMGCEERGARRFRVEQERRGVKVENKVRLFSNVVSSSFSPVSTSRVLFLFPVRARGHSAVPVLEAPAMRTPHQLVLGEGRHRFPFQSSSFQWDCFSIAFFCLSDSNPSFFFVCCCCCCHSLAHSLLSESRAERWEEREREREREAVAG